MKKNTIKSDFFEYLLDDSTAHDFNLIIGNPPFAKKILAGKHYAYYQKLLKKLYPIQFANPQKQFAFLFLGKAMHLLKKKNGELCLIIPAADFLYAEKSLGIRKSLFSTYNVSQIIDFTFLRRVLLQATITSVAIFVECAQSTNVPVTHITAKRTKSSKERLYFEFDHYDFYQVPKKIIAGKINVWKCNLLGGAPVYDIVEKLNKMYPKLKNFYQSKNITIFNTVKKTFLFPNADKYLNANELPLFYKGEIVQKSNESHWGIRKLITKGNFPTDIIINDFKKGDKIEGIGFAGQRNIIAQLKKYFRINSDFICFYIVATSNRLWARGPYIIYKSDFDRFPFVDDLKIQFTAEENIVINDVVKYTLVEYGNGENAIINTENAKKEHLIDFSCVYCNSLNVIYGSENKKIYFDKNI